MIIFAQYFIYYQKLKEFLKKSVARDKAQ